MAGGDGGGVGLGGEAAQAIDVDSAVIAAVAPSTAASRQTCRGQLIVGRVCIANEGVRFRSPHYLEWLSPVDCPCRDQAASPTCGRSGRSAWIVPAASLREEAGTESAGLRMA
jgi:hypothetical protein